MGDVKHTHLRALAAKVPEGPWFHGEDPAEDAPVHGTSLAMVDTGRESDWPIARLTEWHTAEYLAAIDPQTVIGLLDEIERLREALGRIEQGTTDIDAAAIACAAIQEAP